MADEIDLMVDDIFEQTQPKKKIRNLYDVEQYKEDEYLNEDDADLAYRMRNATPEDLIPKEYEVLPSKKFEKRYIESEPTANLNEAQYIKGFVVGQTKKGEPRPVVIRKSNPYERPMILRHERFHENDLKDSFLNEDNTPGITFQIPDINIETEPKIPLAFTAQINRENKLFKNYPIESWYREINQDLKKSNWSKKVKESAEFRSRNNVFDRECDELAADYMGLFPENILNIPDKISPKHISKEIARRMWC